MPARLALAVLISGLACGCGQPAPPPAQPQQPSYRDMPEAYRRTYSEAEFQRMLRGEVVIPERAGGADAEAPAPAPEFSQATPRAALRSFLLCYQQKDWARMLALIPERFQHTVTVETLEKQFAEEHNQELMQKLADGIDGPIDRHGEEASLRYGERFEVVLVLEAGGWKIRDLD